MHHLMLASFKRGVHCPLAHHCFFPQQSVNHPKKIGLLKDVRIEEGRDERWSRVEALRTSIRWSSVHPYLKHGLKGSTDVTKLFRLKYARDARKTIPPDCLRQFSKLLVTEFARWQRDHTAHKQARQHLDTPKSAHIAHIAHIVSPTEARELLCDHRLSFTGKYMHQGYLDLIPILCLQQQI
jgi:hypothetical protein